jgi:ferrous iron transport protein B
VIIAEREKTHISLSKSKKIVLVGNPNVGKSAIFNALTGLSVDISNYPGTTIDVSYGKLFTHDLIDTPGIYGVSSLNDEERIARKIILEADLIVNVVSGLSLDRDLFLTLQLIDMGKPMILVINQWDEAIHRNIQINTQVLSEWIAIPVITTVAVQNKGIDTIKEKLELASIGKTNPDIAPMLSPMLANNIPQNIALLILEGDELSKKLVVSSDESLTHIDKRSETYKSRRQLVNKIVEQSVKHTSHKESISKKIGQMLLDPFWGTITSILVCYFIFYQLLGIWVAGNVVDFTEKQCMRIYWEPNVKQFAASIFPCQITIGETHFDFPDGTLKAPVASKMLETKKNSVSKEEIKYNFWSHHNLMSFIGNALVGEYGILTLTTTYLIGLLMPLVIGFYFGMSILEDSGYLPRLAVLVDRTLTKIGLNGRAIIPLILGLGCVTMATVTTRLLTSTREKIIATFLLGLAIPCSAQLGIVSGTLAKAGGITAWTIYITIIGSILAFTGVLLNMVMPGKATPLMIDLPPMRLPRIDNVFKKTWKKSFNFIKESIPMFALAGLVVTVGEVTGIMNYIIEVLQPFIVSWLRLPNDPRIATTFILGMVRRDFAAFGLTDVTMTSIQAVIAMIVITLFVPCIATVGIMVKERGPRIAFTIWIGSWLAAFAFGTALARILPNIFFLK